MGRMVRLGRLLLLAFALLLPESALADELRVYFFDIGQGDSSLIVSPTGKTVLIDGGPPEGAAHLRARLGQLLTSPIDLVILTHPHLDHLGGLERALSARGARLFMDSGFEHPGKRLGELYDFLQRQRIPVKNARAGRNIDLGGGAQLSIFNPGDSFITGTRSDVNANSVVARLAYGKRHVYFSGDSEEPTEQAVLSRGGDLQSDVYKVAHHGSRHSSTSALLAALRPSIAVISVARQNDYGHPSPECIERLRHIGAKTYRTDQDGEVLVTLGSDGALKVTTGAGEQRSAQAAPAPASASAPSEAGYVASSRAKVFHKTQCPGAKSIQPENRVFFSSRRQAVSSGRTPAKDCNP